MILFMPMSATLNALRELDGYFEGKEPQSMRSARNSIDETAIALTGVAVFP
jgi:hypothetical protein